MQENWTDKFILKFFSRLRNELFWLFWIENVPNGVTDTSTHPFLQKNTMKKVDAVRFYINCLSESFYQSFYNRFFHIFLQQFIFTKDLLDCLHCSLNHFISPSTLSFQAIAFSSSFIFNYTPFKIRNYDANMNTALTTAIIQFYSLRKSSIICR